MRIPTTRFPQKIMGFFLAGVLLLSTVVVAALDAEQRDPRLAVALVKNATSEMVIALRQP